MLELHDVTRRFAEVIALDGVTFDVPRGLTGFIGANGVGKTTTMRIVMGSSPSRRVRTSGRVPPGSAPAAALRLHAPARSPIVRRTSRRAPCLCKSCCSSLHLGDLRLRARAELTALSYLPLTAPIAMPRRLLLQDAAAWERCSPRPACC
jgi:ABC-type branched-subunit amino acid transport system ATPase component